MASAIGTALFCSVLQPMAAKAMDIIKEKGKAIARSMADNAMDNIKRDIFRLQTTLRMIKDMVRVAEVKQIDDDDIQNWLRDLVDIGYEARDVLEDFIAYSSCIRVESSSRLVNFTSSQISFLLSYFGGLSSDTSELPLTVLNQLEKDIRSVRERFDEKKKEGKTFATLIPVVGGGGFESVKTRTPVGPFINKQRDGLFLGREEVKQEIMEKILHPSDDRVDVVVIWGMGGIGKTTLAQSIYNDESVKIVPRKWLCVGESRFCAEKVIMKIIDFSSTNDVESLQENLVKKFEGKTFLIVLDDVWDVDGSEWKLLFDPLTNVGKGGLIIITRRERQLCDEITIQTAYNLQPLSEEDSWSIFESYAYVNGKADSKSELKPIGEEIVKKLNGLPLALKVVGHSLLNKDSSTWTNFLESKFTKNDEVMSALRWSYNHLPQHLKMCFTCCALFPKTHILDKKLLVRMWMAHDLIQKEERKRPEDVGAQYLEELVNASLLQCVDVKIFMELLQSCASHNNDPLIFFDRMYVMHDLIHDLALHVSNGEITTANGSLTNDQIKKVRHITTIEDDLEIPHLCNIEKLQTLYTVWSYDVFKQLKSLRVLVLYSHREIPDCISELKHLRYLDVGPTNKESLPDSICDLYHLQTLVAPSATLPRNIVNMVNLRYIRAVLSTCMGVGKLTYLQELFCIYVCEGDNIRELLDMQLLRGRLIILGLGNVTRFEDAASALMEKQTLIDELKLVFTYECMEYVLSNMCTMEPTISAQVLDALACPPNLKCLEIAGYTGVKSPSLMVDRKHKFDKLQTMKLSSCLKLKFLIHLREFDKLQTLELSNCPKLEFLPFLGELTSLKHLSLSYLYGVKRLGKEFYGEFTDGKVFFPSLESLFFQGMREWKEWDDIIIENSSVSFFPRLTDLEINNCDKLVSVLPVVKNLTINTANFMTSLSCLIISSCKELRSLPADGFPSSLRHLNISACPLLYERCKDESGLDWHKINHIPEREIHKDFSLSDERLIYQMGWVRM